MPHTFVIFGASGDLTHRKLIPALFKLFCKGRLPTPTRIVGMSRTVMSHDEFRDYLLKKKQADADEAFDTSKWPDFAKLVFYHPGDIGKDEDFTTLATLLNEVEQGQSADRIYYLATAPQFYEQAAEQLAKAGLIGENHGVRRLVVEKPFGTNRESARKLNDALHRVLDEKQIYRIDHYLGKETVQNLLVLRFANAIFEPIWNRNFIDNVQITAAEEVKVGTRGAYYDTAGVMRDMFQNHLLQLTMITAMEPPIRYEADSIRNEKVKVLQAVRPLDDEAVLRDTVRAQYLGYTHDPGVAPASQTATFAAIKLHIDNWRWQGVPFFLRSGKEMSCRTTQIVIQFRQPPHLLFRIPRSKLGANRLVIQLQPAEGIQLHFETKVPDEGMQLRETELAFRFDSQFGKEMPEAYERLLLDTLQGDASLFARSDEVETAWGIIDPIINAWQRLRQPSLYQYEPNSWGPIECTEWMHKQGKEWFDTCPAL